MKTSSYLVVAFCLTALIHFDGFVRLFSPSFITGSMNFIKICLYWLLLISVIFVLTFLNHRIKKRFMKNGLVIIILGVSLIPGIINGNINRGIYDFLVITFLFSSVTIIRSYNLLFEIDRKYMLLGLSIAFVLFTLLSVIIGSYVDELGRFSGFLTQSSIFANYAALLAYVTLVLNSQKPWLTITIPFILMSGTRSALLSLMLSYFQNTRALIRILILLIPALLLYSTSLELRIFNFADFENSGSGSTRLIWYTLAWDELKATSYLGGYGARFSNELIGNYPLHFDLLRIWLEYGIVTMIIFIILTFNVLSNCNGNIYVNFCALFILPGFHNALQAPELILVLLIVITLLTKKNTFV